MKLWKQIALSLTLLIGGAIGLVVYAPDSDLITSVPYGRQFSDFVVEVVPGTAKDAARDQAGEKGGKSRRGGRGAPLVVLSPVEIAKTDDTVKSVGSAQAIAKTVLYPESAGRVVRMEAGAGASVEKGAVIVQLDNEIQTIAVERARLSLENAESIVERYQTLAAKNAISTVQLQESQLALGKAHLDLNEAEDALERRAVKAPFSGEIGLIDIGIGDYVTASTAVTTLDDRRMLIVEFKITERFANQTRIGQSISLATPALPGVRLEGAVSGVASRVDPASRTLTVQGTMANREDLVRPGMSFEVSLRFPGKDYAAVPSLAIQWDRNGAFVWTARDGTAVRTDISIVSRTADRVLVTGALSPDDRVISDGTQSVRAGQTFKLAEDGPGGAPEGGRRRASDGVPVAGGDDTVAPAPGPRLENARRKDGKGAVNGAPAS